MKKSVRKTRPAKDADRLYPSKPWKKWALAAMAYPIGLAAELRGEALSSEQLSDRISMCVATAMSVTLGPGRPTSDFDYVKGTAAVLRLASDFLSGDCDAHTTIEELHKRLGAS